MSPKAVWPRAASKRPPSAGRVTEVEASAGSVHDRAAALSSALESGSGCLPAAGVDRARVAIAKTAERTSIAGRRTVVAFAGATGSGKSSLFNVMAGADVARVGVRRPTTSKPTAAIWGSESQSALLDWLRVGSRHMVDEAISDNTVPGPGPADKVVMPKAAIPAGLPVMSGGLPAVPSAPKPAGLHAVPNASKPVALAVASTGLPAMPGAPKPAGLHPMPAGLPVIPKAAAQVGLVAAPADQPQAAPAPAPGLELNGLVLLDLPDFDSQASAHRREADRVLALVDVFIWVTDPQKYADARLHQDYIAKLSAHDAVTITVLNQADRLTPEALAACRNDLLRLIEADGVVNAEVIAVSAKDGTGVDELRHRINAVVRGHNGAVERLDSDLRSAAALLRSSVAESEPGPGDFADASLVDALSRAAGIPVILDAVERDFWRETGLCAGWPVSRWIRALRPAPLKMLGLNKEEPSRPGTISRSDIRSVLGRSSLPPATPAARAAVALATRDLGDRAGRKLPQAWTDAVADAAMPPGDYLADALDHAVMGTSLRARDPFWWTAFGFVQWILAMTAAVGMSWLIVLTVLDWLRLSALGTPSLGPVPYPTILFVGGLLMGYLGSLLTGALGRVGGRRRKVLVAARLQESVAQVVRDQLVAPVQQVVDRHRLTREYLETALKPA
jgi:GTP-binding protein EngB required for normal cell division